MQGGPPGAPYSANVPSGSRDGTVSADHDVAYAFGDRLSTAFHGRFSLRQFARLLTLRSHVQDGDRVPEVLVLQHPERYGLAEPRCEDCGEPCTRNLPHTVLWFCSCFEDCRAHPDDGLSPPACFDDDCSKCQAFLEAAESQ